MCMMFVPSAAVPDITDMTVPRRSVKNTYIFSSLEDPPISLDDRTTHDTIMREWSNRYPILPHTGHGKEIFV